MTAAAPIVEVRKSPFQTVRWSRRRLKAGRIKKSPAIRSRCRSSPLPAARSGDCCQLTISIAAHAIQNVMMRRKGWEACWLAVRVMRASNATPNKISLIAMERGAKQMPALAAITASLRSRWIGTPSVNGGFIGAPLLLFDSDGIRVRTTVNLGVGMRDFTGVKRDEEWAGESACPTKLEDQLQAQLHDAALAAFGGDDAKVCQVVDGGAGVVPVGMVDQIKCLASELRVDFFFHAEVLEK